MLDPEGTSSPGTAAPKRSRATPPSEIIGQHFRIFFTAQDIAAGKPAGRAERRAAAQGRAESEGWRVRKDGSVFWANVVITPVHDGEGRLRGFAKVTRDLSEQRRIDELEQAGATDAASSSPCSRTSCATRWRRSATRCSLMQRARPDRGVAAAGRDIIDRQLGHLTRLVDDLLDVGRITTGKIWLRDELIDYRQVVEFSVESARDAHRPPRPRARGRAAGEAIPLRGDATRLTQALLTS